MALTPNSLTDYATVAARLGLTGGSDQLVVEDTIGEVSDLIRREVGRQLVYGAGLVESVAMYGGGTDLLVHRRPLVAVQQVAFFDSFGGALDIRDPSEWSVRDAGIGALYRTAGWPWSAALRPGLNFQGDQQPGTERLAAQVIYAAGYITKPQAYSASAWPGASAAAAVGLLMTPAGQPTQLWRATPTTAGVAAVTGATQPTWPAAPTSGVTTQADGTVTWTYLGTTGSPGVRGTAVTLPGDLERAAITGTIYLFQTQADDLSIQSEGVGRASVTYQRDQGLPLAVQDLISRYRGGF